MTTIFTRSIWQDVRPHGWKWRPRSQGVDGIIWHCTRGGQGYDGRTEMGATLNWFRSPNNRVHDVRFEDYAGMSHVVIGPDEIVEVVPIDDYLPAWSSHPSDEHAISVEVAQSNLDQAIEPETIANCRRFAAWASARYSFPLERRFGTADDWTWTGEIGHEDTVQGKAQGKSDPGAAFWAPYLALQEDEMTEAQLLAILEARGLIGPGVPTVKRLDEWATEESGAVRDWLEVLAQRLSAVEERPIPMASPPIAGARVRVAVEGVVISGI